MSSIKLARFELRGTEVTNSSGVKPGKLTLPEGISIDGDLIAFAESDVYLHCVISGSGTYYGIFKSDDPNHFYQHILELNL